jgi:hypothetical protein
MDRRTLSDVTYAACIEKNPIKLNINVFSNIKALKAGYFQFQHKYVREVVKKEQVRRNKKNPPLLLLLCLV